MSVSVAIVTKDEELNIRRTLESVKWADEIVLVDSGSTDRTCDIAREFGAKVFFEEWKGFAAQKNSAIQKCTSDWVVSLDADEELLPECSAEIRRIDSDPSAACDAYTIRRRNFFMNRWLKRGGAYPDAKVRFFKRSKALFKERAVHEVMENEGTLGALKGDMNHYAYPTLTLFTEHMNRYSTLGGEIVAAKGRTYFDPFNIVITPVFRFIYNYVFRGAFLDGREGLLFHLYHSVYISWKYAKAWEIGRSRR